MVRTISVSTRSRRKPLEELPRRVRRRRPRSYAEWKALSRWGQLPAWETSPPGYELRRLREGAGLTQQNLAAKLNTTQQAVAQAERPSSNPTVAFMRGWAAACGVELELRFTQLG